VTTYSPETDNCNGKKTVKMALASRLLAHRIIVAFERAARRIGNPSLLLSRDQEDRASINFNRPRFLNSIDDTVINPLAAELSRLADDERLELLLVGASFGENLEKASSNTSSNNSTNKFKQKLLKPPPTSFSAGADLIKGWRIIERRRKEGTIDVADRIYLINFYRSQYLLQKLSKRITTVTIMDGITMGSAVLFGFNSNFSVATERTVWAVPEVTIGSVPDVGCHYHLNKKASTGRLLALTGARLKGQEVSALGLSTHFCKSSLLPALSNQLASCKPGEVGEVLDQFMRESGGRGGGEEENRLNIAWAEAEQAGHLAGTFARLAELAPEYKNLLTRACPLSVRVTARLLEDGAKDTHSEALLRAYSVAGNIYFCPEMSRGIEAALLGGGRAAPNWSFSSLDKVPDTLVEHCFSNKFKEGQLSLAQLQEKDTSLPY